MFLIIVSFLFQLFEGVENDSLSLSLKFGSLEVSKSNGLFVHLIFIVIGEFAG